MNYCVRCILPDTRPNIRLGTDGVCNACSSHATKKYIQWTKREMLFRDVISHVKSRSHGYDCVVPVSGGKDSHWQVIKCLEYGLVPLAVTWKTPARTELGTRNLTNLVGIGVDHIDFQVNPTVEREFMYQALVRYGDPAIPMHMALFNIPLKIANNFDIPLVVWGENSAFEYGDAEDQHKGFKMDSLWLETYGVNAGTSADEWISKQLTAKMLLPYFGPKWEELEQKGILSIFLGYYFPWDPEISLETALRHGFQVREDGPRTGYYNFADIDDEFISIHHFFKWYKFGFTRLFDNLSVEIRNGRFTREAAISMVRRNGDQTPFEDIESFCQFLGISRKKFFDVAETFRNPDIWTQSQDKWFIKDFLIEDWNWT